METLPKLCGRAKVTFSIQRPINRKITLGPDNFLASLLPATAMTTLGNITIVADGFTAPLTAGNFVDLARRGFYTGLPIREKTKRVGDIAMNLPILGSFNEGFNDPFTAKVRGCVHLSRKQSPPPHFIFRIFPPTMLIRQFNPYALNPCALTSLAVKNHPSGDRQCQQEDDL